MAPRIDSPTADGREKVMGGETAETKRNDTPAVEGDEIPSHGKGQNVLSDNYISGPDWLLRTWVPEKLNCPCMNIFNSIKRDEHKIEGCEEMPMEGGGVLKICASYTF